VPATDRPTFSAVLASYNGERFLRSTLESLLAQSAPLHEIVVCDDGSRDGTRELVLSFGERVRLVAQENRGVSAARNRAAALASGDVLAFCDQDDLWEPRKVEVQRRQLVERPELGFVYSDAWIVDAEGRERGRRREHLDYAEGNVFERLLEGNFVPVETLAIPTGVFRALGGFDERARFVEDWELCLRVARRHPVGFWPEPLARYRIHGKNLSYDMEGILGEYAAVLEDLPRRMPDLDEREREHVARVLRRRRAELAWYALKRRDFAAAEGWLEGAHPVRPRSLALKLAFGRALLAGLPAPLARRLSDALRRRGLFGSPR
jgi:glycosyltransferase involved in cell wall biosynthesis